MSAPLSFLFRHRKATLVLASVVVLGSAFAVTGTRVDNSLDAWFPGDDPGLASYRSFQQRYGGDEVVVTALHADAPLDQSRLARLVELTAELRRIDGVARVVSLADFHVAHEGALSPVIVPPVGDDDVERARRALDDGGVAARFLGRDGRTLVVASWLSAQAERDGERTRILAAIRASTARSLEGEESASHGGMGLLYDDLNRVTIDDGGMFIALSYLVIVLLVFAITRRLLWTALAVVVVTCADLALLGAMALWERPLTAFTMALPALVLVLGVAGVIHVAARLDGHARAGLPLDERRLTLLLSSTLGACGLNALTTAIGFASLLVAENPITRDFGAFAAVGVLLAYAFLVVALVVVGRARLVRAARAPGASLALASAVAALAMQLALRRRRAVLLVAGAALVVSGVGVALLRVDTYSLGLLPEEHETRVASALLEERVGPYVPLELEVRAAGALSDPRVLSSLARAQLALERQHGLRSTLSVVDLLRDARGALTGAMPERGWSPATAEEAAQLYALVELTAPEHARGLWADGGDALRLTVAVPMVSARAFGRLLDEARASAASHFEKPTSVEVTGYLPVYCAMVAHVVRDQAGSLALALVPLSLLLVLLARRRRLAVAAVVANLVPVALLLGVMGLSGTRLDIATVTIASAVLGVIVDDTIHFVLAMRRALAHGLPLDDACREVARESGGAMLCTSVILVAGFAVIGLGTVPSVAAIGALSALGVAAALLCDLMLLPALLATRRSPAAHAP